MLRVGILTTHPIQYDAPFFRQLVMSREWEPKVLYCHRASPEEQGAAGFGKSFDWDVPLMEGYDYRFLNNVSLRPSIANFGGLDTPEVRRLVSEERFDAMVVHGWHYKSAWQAIRACWNARVPVLVRSDSHLKSLRHPVKRAVKWPLYRWAIPRLDACLAAGQWSRNYFVHYGADQSRIFVVPRSIDSFRLSHQANELAPGRNELRQRWQLPSDEVVWLFAGKFIEKKRPLDFIAAVLRARQMGARVCGLMVGNGPLLAHCESYVKDHRAPIRFGGFLNQTEIAIAYVAADGLVLPSDGRETWGLVVNEAMTCGKPCLVSDQVGCGPDLIEEGRTGAVFSMGDVEAFSEALCRYSDFRRLAAMGTDARNKIRQHSVEAAVSSLTTALSKTMERRVSSTRQPPATILNNMLRRREPNGRQH